MQDGQTARGLQAKATSVLWSWGPTTRPHCRSRSYDLAPHRYDDRIVTDIFRLQLLLATFTGWINRHQNAIAVVSSNNRLLASNPLDLFFR